MEIEQNYILHGFGKEKLKALEDKIICEYKSLFSENVMEYKYEEIDPKPIKGKASDQKWSEVGGFLMITFICISLLNHNRLILYYIELPVLILALASFAMLFRKKEYISFYVKSSDRYVSIIKPTQHKEFVDYISRKIEKANQKQ